MIIRFLFLLSSLAALVLAGCAANPSTAYSIIAERKDVYELSDAAKGSKNTKKIVLGVEYKMGLSSENEVLIDGSRRSSFQRVEFSITQERDIEITVNSLCDCFGGNRFIISPQVRLSDSSGREIDLQYVSRSVQGPGLIGVAKIVGKWAAESVKPGNYSLLIFADNRNISLSASSFRDTALVSTGGAIVPVISTGNLIYYPYGSFTLQVE